MLACFHCPFICSYITFLFFLSSTNAALIPSRLAWNLSSCTRVLKLPRCFAFAILYCLLNSQNCVSPAKSASCVRDQVRQVALKSLGKAKSGLNVWLLWISSQRLKWGKGLGKEGCNTSNARGNRLRWAFPSIILGANKFWTSVHKLLVKVGDFLPKKLISKQEK